MIGVEDGCKFLSHRSILVVVKEGGIIGGRGALACWWHQVAHRVAIQANIAATRRRTLERQVGQMAVATSANAPAPSIQGSPGRDIRAAAAPHQLICATT